MSRLTGDHWMRRKEAPSFKPPVNLESVSVEAEALPKSHLVQIAIEMELEHAVIGGALVDATRDIAKALVHGVTADADTDIGK